MISAKIICDSIGPSGKRLTTFELVYPRFILAELNTHRALSRNSASSRAIPIEKMIQRVLDDPAMPVFWAANQKGMQAIAEVGDIAKARETWLDACYSAVDYSRKLAALGLHKAIANRVTEPFQHMVTVVSATEWANFFHLRYHPAAQQEFQTLAQAMYEAYQSHIPQTVYMGEWHLPYIKEEDREEAYQIVKGVKFIDFLKKVSVGRCARTSYVNQNGKRSLEDDVTLHDRLMSNADSGEPGHWSPFEHVAMATLYPVNSGNFIGFEQYRKAFSNENTTTMPVLGKKT